MKTLQPLKTPGTALLLALFLGTAPVDTSRAEGAELAVGDPAPDVALEGPDGKPYRLADLLAAGGDRGIILAWFPKAFTPG